MRRQFALKYRESLDEARNIFGRADIACVQDVGILHLISLERLFAELVPGAVEIMKPALGHFAREKARIRRVVDAADVLGRNPEYRFGVVSRGLRNGDHFRCAEQTAPSAIEA